jgi:predicted nuclease of predicted toxin-antitoxin system
MKLLLDSCVWGRAAETLRNAGHDVTWAGDWSEDPGDDEILARARNEQRTLVTLDKDFGELAIVFEMAHCGIIRLVNFGARQQGPVCLQVITTHSGELESGAIVTASPGRIRIRPAPGSETSDLT